MFIIILLFLIAMMCAKTIFILEISHSCISFNISFGH